MSLAIKRAELDAKRKALNELFAEAGADMDMAQIKTLSGDSAAKAAELKRRMTEVNALGEEVDDLVKLADGAKASREAEEKANQPQGSVNFGSGQAPTPAVKSLGEYASEVPFRGRLEVPIDAKVLMTTAAGWAPETIRLPGYVESAQVSPTLVDAIPSVSTNQSAITFMEETTFTNNAAERAEGANNAGEAALALTLNTSTVREITVWLPVTREQMDDVSYVQGYVNNRLATMLRLRLNTQIAAGNGVAPNLAGLIGLANCQTQAKGADPVMDALHKGIVLGQTTGACEPNLIALNPLDWQDIRLTRTADGIYILGSPAEAGPSRLWGLPVIVNSAVTQNTGLVVDTSYLQLAFKQGVQLEYTDSHASLFIQRTLAILASVRVAFVCFRPGTVVNVTGI